MRSKKTFIVAISAAALVAVLAVGGVYAYLTYTAQVTNTFTVGNVTATLTEPAWTDAEDGAHDNIYPGQSIGKDPTVTMADGSNPAVVFIEVTYPVKEVITVGDDGKKQAAAETQLFTPGTLGEGWMELSSLESSGEGTVTKVYGLDTELEAGSAATLFETVTFANVAEGQVVDDVDIVVRADVIQAGGMTKAGDKFTAAELGSVYGKFVAQNPSDAAAE